MLCMAVTDTDIENCFDVINELRPHLVKDQFVETVRSMENQGFKLAFVQVDSQVVAVAGYRIYNNLYMGKHCYIDDFVTASAYRSKGYGEKMIAWLRHQALQAGCDFSHLNSGTHRGRAHKFYFDQGFTIASYHFSQALR